MEEFETLPKYFQDELRSFLKNEKNRALLEEHLKRTPIMLEDGNFQLSIESLAELRELLEFLKHPTLRTVLER